MRTFKLVRHEDETGVSGTGVVASGAIFDNGRVAMQWQVPNMPESLVWYTCIEDMERVHLHGGKTVVEYDYDIDKVNKEQILDILERISNFIDVLYKKLL